MEFAEYFKEWNQETICERLARGQTRWKFNPPGTPLCQGVYERLVRICRKSIIAIIRNRLPTLPVLIPTMGLVEHTLNDGKFTRVGDYPEDLEVLTPSHFLFGRLVVTESSMPDSFTYIDCGKMYKVTQAFSRMIWNRWTKKYLPKWNVRPKSADDNERDLKSGDFVWLMDEVVRRHERKMARMTKCSTELMVSSNQHQSEMLMQIFKDPQ